MTEFTTLAEWNIGPTFPFTVTINGASVTLHGDGTWSGDIIAVKQAMKDMKGSFGDAGLLAWLLLRQMMAKAECPVCGADWHRLRTITRCLSFLRAKTKA